jgi:sirohydrochlorin cobaltochelatase
LDAILIFSHGSVLCGAEQNLLALAQRMRERGDAAIVEVGFLNYTEPSFETAVQRCAGLGATRILIAPYFLIAGKFVVQDLPRHIETAKEAHPGIEFVTADAIGFHDAMADAILASALTARDPGAWLDAIVSNEEWCRENHKCPMYGSTRCKAGLQVRA